MMMRLQQGLCMEMTLFFGLLFISHVSASNERNSESIQYPRHRRKPQANFSLYSAQGDDDEPNRMSILNMTCSFFSQPLNHFSLPRMHNATFAQRFCVYDDFLVSDNATVLLYVGNESPLEQYINNTGLMWEMAERLNAQVVFVEHRYEGESLPNPAIPNCMAYSSTVQALADYANFIENGLFLGDAPNATVWRRPVIAFGGSYGGMLAAWIRMKYPNLIAGAIAASAPIWGFPRAFPDKIDAAWQVVEQGLHRSYPPTLPDNPENNCPQNLLAAWPIISVLAETGEGRDLLTQSFRLCDPLTAAHQLIAWGQSPWFDLAEGSFPYPSSYIPFALTHNKDAVLPAWPLQAACWTHSSLHRDFGISFIGNVSTVQYEIEFSGTDDKKLNTTVVVDWDNATSTNHQVLIESDAVADLLESVRDAVSVWFNVTKDVECFSLDVAPNTKFRTPKSKESAFELSSHSLRSTFSVERERVLGKQDNNSTASCQAKMNEGSWPSLCCNEEMNLIITAASGLGRDMLWPPSHTKGTASFRDIMHDFESLDGFCTDDDGIFGYPDDSPDPWSTFYDSYYGGTHIQSHSNIVFSNGLLDPWSAAGVYAPGLDPTPPDSYRVSSYSTGADVPGLYIQNISESGSMIALIMDYGGHHTDLMYSRKTKDPPCIREARVVEESMIQVWVKEWWKHEV